MLLRPCYNRRGQQNRVDGDAIAMLGLRQPDPTAQQMIIRYDR